MNLEKELEGDKIGEGETKKLRRKSGRVLHRLVLEKEPVEALDELVLKVNDGFTAGEVTRSDLAAYLLLNASRLLGKNEITKIRHAFFDERKALDHLLRESESSGQLPDEIRKLLKDQFRSSVESRKE